MKPCIRQLMSLLTEEKGSRTVVLWPSVTCCLHSGSNPTLYDGIVELTPFEWLIPIEEGLQELNVEFAKVQPQDLQIDNPALEPIRTKWLGMRDSNPRSWDQNPVPYRLANPQ